MRKFNAFIIVEDNVVKIRDFENLVVKRLKSIEEFYSDVICHCAVSLVHFSWEPESKRSAGPPTLPRGEMGAGTQSDSAGGSTASLTG